MGNIYRVPAGFDTSYGEFKDLCRKTWKNEGVKCLLIDRVWKIIEEKLVFVEKTKRKVPHSVYRKQNTSNLYTKFTFFEHTKKMEGCNKRNEELYRNLEMGHLKVKVENCLHQE